MESRTVGSSSTSRIRLPGRFVERARVDVVLGDVFDFIGEERRRGGVVFRFLKMVVLVARSQDPVLPSNWVTNSRLVIRDMWRFLSSLIRHLMARTRMGMFSGFSMKASTPNCTAFRY